MAECANKYGNKAVHYMVAEATCEADSKALADFTFAKFGKIDIVVLAAGIAAHSLVKDISDLNIARKVMEVNYMGFVMLAKYVLPGLRQSKGQFVVISSGSALMPLPLRAPYCASKAATNMFFKTISIEEPNVSVSILCPDSFTGSNFRNNSLIKS